jgi:hypothetical protein
MRLWKAMLVVITAGSPAARAADIGGGGSGGAEPKPAADKPPPHYVEIPIRGPRAELQSAIASQPLSAEQDARLAPLIRQLGDADFRKREAAVDQLKAMGPTALESLKQARDGATDPELANRADSVVRFLQQATPRRSLADAYQGRDTGRFGRDRVGRIDGNVLRITPLENGGKLVEVRENGNRTLISDGPDGIEMSIATGDAVREVQARTPEQLKKHDEEAFNLYQKWMGRGGPGGVIQWGGRRGRIPLPPAIPAPGRIRPVAPPPPPPPQINPFNNQPNVAPGGPEQQQREMLRLLEELRRAQGGAGAAGGGDARAQPVPAVAPRSGRLGVRILEGPEAEMVTVTEVLPGERAEKLGLKPMDTIRSLNGHKVTDADSLRQTLVEAKGPFVVEIVRDGQTLKLAEKP